MQLKTPAILTFFAGSVLLAYLVWSATTDIFTSWSSVPVEDSVDQRAAEVLASSAAKALVGELSLSEAAATSYKHMVKSGRQLLVEYYRALEGTVDVELRALFEELDENKDGFISIDEFRDRRLAPAAAMRIASRQMQSNADFVRVTYESWHATSWVGIFWMLIKLQLVFLTALFVWDNLTALVQPAPRVLDLKCDYVNAKPATASVEEAMKYDTPLTNYERFKLAFFALTGLIVVRTVLIVVSFVGAVTFINLASFRGRNRTKNPMWFWACERVVQLFAVGLFAGLGYYRIRVYGKVAPIDQVKLLVANHVATYEVVMLFVLAHFPSFVSRVENLRIPLMPGVAATSQAILVDRDASASRAKTLETIKRRAKDPSANQLMIFPEGTCAMQRGVFLFKRGAFEAGEPVQMVCFAFPYKHFNATWNGRCCGGNDFLDLWLRTLSQFVNHAEIAFLPPYHPTEAERQDPLLYASHVQSMVAAVTRQPISVATYADYVALEKKTRRAVYGREITVPSGRVKSSGGSATELSEAESTAASTPPLQAKNWEATFPAAPPVTGTF
jgi:1-acyl-sn-glycerol-3-phosphate acyltransferase